MKPYMSASKDHTENPKANLFVEHTHDLYEIYCFISGDAKYFVEGNIYELNHNDILIIKKSETHTLLINKPVPYTRCVVHFNATSLLGENSNELISTIDEKPLGRFNRISSTDAQKSRWLYYLDYMSNTESFEEKRLYLTILLSELSKNININEYESYSMTENEKIIEYINQNLSEITTLDEICNHFYISKTHLNRKFKSLTGTTVWDYIITKRLISAKDLLISGCKPNIVSEKCGWMEYSSFYRAYKQRFGISPSEVYRKK